LGKDKVMQYSGLWFRQGVSESTSPMFTNCCAVWLRSKQIFIGCWKFQIIHQADKYLKHYRYIITEFVNRIMWQNTHPR